MDLGFPYLRGLQTANLKPIGEKKNHLYMSLSQECIKAGLHSKNSLS